MINRHKVRTAVFVALLPATFLPGCGGENAERVSAMAELAGEQAIWQSHNINDYSFTLSVDCFCVVSGPVHFVVRNGEMQSGFIERDQRELAETEREFLPTTIPELFSLIEEVRTETSSTLEVEYAEELGYPSSVVIDREKMAFDAGRAYSVTQFKVD